VPEERFGKTLLVLRVLLTIPDVDLRDEVDGHSILLVREVSDPLPGGFRRIADERGVNAG
jgi:hypothetical protein